MWKIYRKIYGVELIEFNKIIGHEKIKKYLDNSINSDRVANAYIFSGAKGLGKFRVAKIFAKELLNINSEECQDLIVVDNDGKTIGVDLVREKIVDDIVIRPMEKNRKVYIIKQAHKLTVQAQNALLKTLEEPPEYAIVILICNDDRKLLSTIKSRSQILYFTSPSIEEATNCIVERLKIPEEDAKMLAKITDCNIGQAIRYSNIFKNKENWDKLIHVLRHLHNMKNYEIVYFVKQLETDERDLFIHLLFCLYRDILNYKISGDPNSIILKNMRSEIMKIVKVISYECMYESVDAISKAIDRIEANANIVSVMEVLLMTIKENNR